MYRQVGVFYYYDNRASECEYCDIFPSKSVKSCDSRDLCANLNDSDYIVYYTKTIYEFY